MKKLLDHWFPGFGLAMMAALVRIVEGHLSLEQLSKDTVYLTTIGTAVLGLLMMFRNWWRGRNPIDESVAGVDTETLKAYYIGCPRQCEWSKMMAERIAQQPQKKES